MSLSVKRIRNQYHKLWKKGSLTLEATMVLPLFLFLVLNLFAAINDLYLHLRMQCMMRETALELSRYAYAYDAVAGGSDVLQSEIADISFSETYVREKIKERVGAHFLNRVGISGGSGGISYLQCDIVGGEDIKLTATYQMRGLFLPAEISTFQMVNHVRTKRWTGYDNTQNSVGGGEDQIVYITETGSVYHTSRSCSYLNLSIRQTTAAQVCAERNAGGGRYYACERCMQGISLSGGMTLYITQDGNRYHASLSCSALSRYIQAVLLSEVGDRPPCSRCGGAHG